jgi:hypothetical protein
MVDPAVLERRLSTERLAPYRAAVCGDAARTIALYEWNAEVGAAFWAVVGHIEVLVRNAIHDQLTNWFTEQFHEPQWYLDPGRLLTAQARLDIAGARSRAVREDRVETPGRVVAELTFGFWRYLLAVRYERSLWRTCLWQAWPGQGLRREVHDKVAQLHVLRNRIAHHEPIHNRPLDSLHDTAMTVAGWVCPVTRDWIGSLSRVAGLLLERPRPAAAHRVATRWAGQPV